MIKYILGFLLIVTPGFTKMVGAIAVTVNNSPITLYEIKMMAKSNQISKEDALNALIQKKIEEEEIQKEGIFATPDEVDKRVQAVAQQNKLSLSGLEKALIKEGTSMKELKEELERQIKKEKLYQKILAGKMKKPSEEELKAFYKAHQKEFTIPGKIKILEYASKDPRALQAVRMQPMLMLPNVKITPREIDPRKVNPQLVALLLKTPTKEFTPIINLGQNAAMFFVQSKGKSVVAPFEQVKQNIFLRLMKEQEQANLIAYFEKKKSEADIKVLRKP